MATTRIAGLQDDVVSMESTVADLQIGSPRLRNGGAILHLDLAETRMRCALQPIPARAENRVASAFRQEVARDRASFLSKGKVSRL